MDSSERTIFLSEQDATRLRALIDTHGWRRDQEATESLEDELGRAVLLAPGAVPPNVVTMNSRVVYRDEATGSVDEVTLVYPRDADPARKRISVLAPLGTALLGLMVGQVVSWRMPGGHQRLLRVLAVPYQPEAAGDLNL